MATRSSDKRNTATSEALRALVGRNIAHARDRLGWSQGDLARAAGIEDSQKISKWERGVYLPSTDALTALSVALKKDLGWLFTDHGIGEKAA